MLVLVRVLALALVLELVRVVVLVWWGCYLLPVGTDAAAGVLVLRAGVGPLLGSCFLTRSRATASFVSEDAVTPVYR